MKIVRFVHGDSWAWGAVSGGDVHLIDHFRYDERVTLGERHAPLSEVRLLAPILPPRNVFCLGRNYLDHIKEGPAALEAPPPAPIWFTKSTTAVAGPDSDVVVDPAVTSKLDWEAELGVVIGRGGKNIAEKDALSHVFGYTVVNDLSARDLQFDRGQWFLGKSLDSLLPAGPVVLTADEVPDPQNLELRLRVNGVERQAANTRDMIFNIVQSIADLSRGITLLPGDVIATGTPSGTGMGMKPPVFLQNGDVVEAEIPGIGVLRNTIVFRSA
jgi:2-keto-4-pentenoate hydratase/2-oxohepta-3-ene-1,7-dioic acid hydratase in catechol pathway